MKMGVKGALVIAEGEHLCMRMRGVKNSSNNYDYGKSRHSKSNPGTRTIISTNLNNKSHIRTRIISIFWIYFLNCDNKAYKKGLVL